MTASFAPTTKPNIPGMYTCDGDGLTPKMKLPKYACDGDGLGVKLEIPTGAKTLVADKFEGSNAAGSEKKGIGAKGILTTAILLIGGAMLGYGHREHISKGLNAVKGKISEFFATGKPAEYLAKGKEVLGKVKDTVFAKAA